VRLLLDTQSLLALLSSDYRLSPAARDAMERPDARLIVSAVSVWEIAIKRSAGRLEAPDDVLELIEEAGTELLAITALHAQAVATLPFHHRDPFDRLLIAQAQLERCAIVTGDRAFPAYDVPVVW
jgi:PIN domain nuclease of toxin-antitoxin system